MDAWTMFKAREHYEALRYVLKDTSRFSPFDYVASKDGDERTLEVKGLTGPLGPVIVTSDEVQSARDGNIPTDLLIIYGIELIETSPGVFQGQSGTVHVIRIWIPEDCRLKPLQFRYHPFLHLASVQERIE